MELEIAHTDPSIATFHGEARLAGNGILLDHHVGRLVAEAEALYSYEGTCEKDTLIVERSIIGISAFV